MPPGLLEFLYYVAVRRAERKQFYDNPGTYIDAYNKRATTKYPVSPADKQMLIQDVTQWKAVIQNRKNAVKAIPFVSQLQKKYAVKMPEFEDDTDSIFDED